MLFADGFPMVFPYFFRYVRVPVVVVVVVLQLVSSSWYSEVLVVLVVVVVVAVIVVRRSSLFPSLKKEVSGKLPQG